MSDEVDGVVKSVRTDKGYGFISSHGHEDVFFHVSQLKNLVWEEQLTGRRVKFRLITTERGPKATHVRAAD
jgi:cold shock CspA family protein